MPRTGKTGHTGTAGSAGLRSAAATLSEVAGTLGASIASSLNQGMTESARIQAQGSAEVATALTQLTNATLTNHSAMMQAFSELRTSQEETNQLLLRGVSQPPPDPP